MIIAIVSLSIALFGCGWLTLGQALRRREAEEKLELVLSLQEHALDVLETCYKNLVRVSSTPVLYDSAEVRTLLEAIKDSRDAILVVASEISNEADKLVNENK